MKRFDPIVIKNALKFIYTRDVSHLKTKIETSKVVNLCRALGIKNEFLAELGTRYYEILIKELPNYDEPGVKEMMQLERLPVGKINFNAYNEITPKQFLMITENMSKEILPKIEISQCQNLGEKELQAFRDSFRGKLRRDTGAS